MVMKIYCEKCKKVFEAEKPEEGNQVSCTFCREKVDFPESPTSPGAVIGDFLIEKEISKGGMGEVYLARQLSLDRPVALKVLQAKFLNDKEYVESFFREARAAGRDQPIRTLCRLTPSAKKTESSISPWSISAARP